MINFYLITIDADVGAGEQRDAGEQMDTGEQRDGGEQRDTNAGEQRDGSEVALVHFDDELPCTSNWRILAMVSMMRV